MHPAPDHSPAAAAAEHAALIVALDAGDLAGRERDDATTFATTCAGCASLLEDLAVLRAATSALVVTPRTRDFRLTEADAARLRPSTWRSLVRWLAAPRSTVRPLAGGLAALGIAGLLLTTTPGFFGGAATSLSTTGAPVVAPGGGAEGAGGAVGGSALPNAASNAAPSAAASAAARPNGAAPIGPTASAAPAASPVPGAPGTTPGLAALPAPSPATVAGPAPTPIPDAGTVAGPAAAATASTGPSDFSTDAGAPTDSTKAVPPEISQGARSAVPATRDQPAPQDRTVPLLLSLALLVAGFGLLVANRVLRGRAGS